MGLGSLAISLPQPTSAVWLGLSILVHLATLAGLMILANHNAPERSSGLHLISGDEPEYKASVENLIIAGDYMVDSTDPASRASRLPGYALTYLPFRLLLGPDRGPGALALMQTILGGAAAYGAALIAFRLTLQPAAFWAALTLGLMPSFPMVFNAYTVPDGLAASVALFTVVSALAFDASGRLRFALATGVFGIYLFFLRAFTAPILAFLSVFLWFAADHVHTGPSGRVRKRWRRALALTAFLAPILAAEGGWIAKLVPAWGVHPSSTGGLRLERARASGTPLDREPRGRHRGLAPEHDRCLAPDRPRPDTAALPANVSTPACGVDRLLRTRALYRHWLGAEHTATGEDLGSRVAAEFDACRVAYEAAHPFDHLVLARARLLKGFLIHAGPPLPLPPFRSMRTLSAPMALKLLTAICYGLTIVLSSVGLLLLVSSRNREALLIASIPIYFLVLFPFVLGYIETRYVTTAYPFFVIAAAVTLSMLATCRLPVFGRVTRPSAGGTVA